jgi:hypothetical protein
MYVGTAFGICFVLYFTLGKQNVFLYILVSALLLGGSLALAFIKIEGRGVPVVGKNKANKELIKFLAKEFDASKSDITIISGASEHIKLVKIIK